MRRWDSLMTAPDHVDAVYSRLFPKLVGALSLYCGDRWVAEEIAQETLSRLWERSASREVESPDAWSYRVAFNLAKSWFRRRAIERRVRPERERAVDGSDDATVDDIVMRAAIDRLPPRQRQAVVLRYFADLSVDDTATVMRCAPGTVKAHTHKALAALAGSGLDDERTRDG
jgi:RNA polymerase sigma factor (sigma-70 family)